jgi:cobalt-zinc-cadmium resistance protein CzcA
MMAFRISNFQRLLILIPIGLLVASSAMAQKITEDEAINTALQNNQLMKSAENQVDYFRQIKKTGSDFGKLTAVWMNGQYNTIEKDNNITLTQHIPFPGTIGAQLKLGEEQIIGSTKSLLAAKNNLAFEVRSVYETLVYQKAFQNLLLSQDSLYTEFARASTLRYKTGESNLLEMTTAETQLQEIKNLVRQNESDIFMSQRKLQALLKSETLVDASALLSKRLVTIDPTATSLEANPQLQYSQQLVKISEQERRVEKNRLMPDLIVGYFNQTLIGYQNTTGQDKYYGNSDRFQGFSVGLAVPLWFAPQVAKAKAASFMEESNRQMADYFRTTLNSDYEQALREMDKNQASLTYYERSALKNANLILTQARKAYRGGEIGYVEYLQSLRSAITIKTNYLHALNQYNLSVIKVEYLTGKL